MNQMVMAWVAIAAMLIVKSVGRPSYAVSFYLLTFLVAPRNWWWGHLLEGYRWNFLAGILLLIVVVRRMGETIDGKNPLATNAAPLLGALAANAVVIHLLFAVNADSSLGWLILRLKFILLFFLIQYSIRDEKDYRNIALAIALGIGYVGYEATINDRGHFRGGRLEGIGVAGVDDANQLASLLLIALPIAVTMLFTQTSKWVKGGVILCCGLAFNVLLLCDSRGAFLGLLLAGPVFLLMASGPARKRSLRILGLAALATLLLMGDPRILQRFMTTFSVDGPQDSSAEHRIVFWTAASHMIADHPFGSGGNSFSEGRGWRYMPKGDSESGSDSDNQAGDTRAVHNGFITETADWGVQGLALMLSYLGAVFWTIRRGRRIALDAGDANAVMVLACITAGLVAWLVSSIFGDYLAREWGFWTAALPFAYIRVHSFRATPAKLADVQDVGVAATPISRVGSRGFAS